MKTYEVMKAVRGSALRGMQRWVLTCVAHRAGEDGDCWASATTLADDVGVDERTVRRTLSELVKLGALSVVTRKGQTAVYRLTGKFPTPDTLSGGSGHPVTPDILSPRTERPGTPDNVPGPPRTNCPDTPDRMSDDPIPDPTQDPIPDPTLSDARVDHGGLVADPKALRGHVHDRHAAALAQLLDHCKRQIPDHAFSPRDIKSLRPAIDRWGVDRLLVVWDHHQAGVDTRFARESGWSTSWASIANDRLPDRIRSADRWDRAGRPTERAPPLRPDDWRTVGRAGPPDDEPSPLDDLEKSWMP